MTEIDRNPTYHYNPDYHFKGVHSRKPFTIKPGPNNPVGTMWINLSGDGYGIHGTPFPGKVSKSESHGCVRLTNWDAERVAERVSKGTPVDVRRRLQVGSYSSASGGQSGHVSPMESRTSRISASAASGEMPGGGSRAWTH